MKYENKVAEKENIQLTRKECGKYLPLFDVR